MDRRRFVAVAAAAPLAGCAGPFGDSENGRLDLTVRNDGSEPVTVQVDVVADDGTTYAEESDRIDGGVARSFAVAVGTSGRHVVAVSGDDFRGELAWDAWVCRRFDGTVAVADGSVEVVGECAEQR